MRLFTDMMVDGVHCGPDGMRADVDGNMWISSNAPLGYSGVLAVNSAGKIIGRIRLPEVCANLVLRRSEAQLPAHVRQPVDLRAAGANAGRRSRLTRALSATSSNVLFRLTRPVLPAIARPLAMAGWPRFSAGSLLRIL